MKEINGVKMYPADCGELCPKCDYFTRERIQPAGGLNGDVVKCSYHNIVLGYIFPDTEIEDRMQFKERCESYIRSK
jgi:hypothetical protein